MLNASRARRFRTYVWLGVVAVALLLAALKAMGVIGPKGLLGHKPPAQIQSPVVPAESAL